MEKEFSLGTEFKFLIEKDAMWAEMLMQALRENDVPCTAQPVHGAGLTMKTGMKERMRVFVPADRKSQAEDIMEELFSGDSE